MPAWYVLRGQCCCTVTQDAKNVAHASVCGMFRVVSVVVLQGCTSHRTVVTTVPSSVCLVRWLTKEGLGGRVESGGSTLESRQQHRLERTVGVMYAAVHDSSKRLVESYRSRVVTTCSHTGIVIELSMNSRSPRTQLSPKRRLVFFSL